MLNMVLEVKVGNKTKINLKYALKDEWELKEISVIPVILGATGIMKDTYSSEYTTISLSIYFHSTLSQMIQIFLPQKYPT